MKINKRLRKAFTLVELVVVIAIIAILSTVSVVTYFGITNSAKKSVDDTLITELNKCLQLDETINGKPNTPSEALEVVEENGFTVEKMTPTQDKKEIVWHQTTNKFELVDEIKVQSRIKNAEGTTNISTWRFLSEYTSNGGYSIYLKDADFSGEALTLNITTGLDVGKNTEDFNITYESTSGNEVTIRTNGGILSVNTSSDNINYYGKSNKVNINTTKENNFVSFADIGEIELTSGNVRIEEGKIDTIRVVTVSTENVSVEVKEKASVNAVAAIDESVASNLTDIVKVPASSNTSIITTKVGHLPPFAVSGLGTKEMPYIWNGTGANGEKLTGYNPDGTIKKNDVLAYWVSRYADAMDLYIKLGCDVLGTSTSNYIFQVQKSGKLHFDLAGHTMNVATQKAVFFVYGSDKNMTANLTINDSVGTGKVIYNGLSTGSLGVSLVRAYSASKENATSKVTINGGTFETASTKSKYASPVVLAYGTKDKKNVSGIVDITINNGTFLSSVCADGSGNSTVLMASDNEKSKITINNGYFETAGTFANRQYVLNAQDNFEDSIIVNGGTYKNYIPGQTDTGSTDKIIVSGTVVDNEDYTWTVTKNN